MYFRSCTGECVITWFDGLYFMYLVYDTMCSWCLVLVIVTQYDKPVEPLLEESHCRLTVYYFIEGNLESLTLLVDD